MRLSPQLPPAGFPVVPSRLPGNTVSSSILGGVCQYAMAPTWATYPAKQWAAACAHPGGGLKDPKLRKILPELYKLFPQPGRPSHQEMPVWVRQGGAIDWHAHPEAVVIYYVYPGDPPVPLLLGDVPAGRILTPEANTAVYLPPNTPHAVAISRSESPRLSLALRWIQGERDPD